MPLPEKFSLSVVMPAHNEVENIERVVRHTWEVLADTVPDSEIIVVNDGSHDGTGELLDRLAKEIPALRPVHHPINRGYGGALQTGFATARKEFLFFCDSDGQFDFAEIRNFFDAYDGQDAILGFRIDRRDPFHRKVFAKCWGMLIRLLFGLHVRDLDCAFKLFRRSLLEGISLQAEGAMITVELLAQFHKKKFRFIEIGVHHYPRLAGEQSGGSPKVVLKAFRELFRLYGRLSRSA